MGNLLYECNCEKEKDVEDYSNDKSKEIPKS